jgi:hypothetical protein
LNDGQEKSSSTILINIGIKLISSIFLWRFKNDVFYDVKILIFLYFILFSSSVFSKEIPIIVISAGKNPQSYSSVGSQVTIIDSEAN